MAFPDISPESVSRTARPFHRAELAADGVPQFYEPHPFLQQIWTVAWSLLTQAERDSISEHHATYRSSFFNFFDPLLRKITDRLVGTGTGAATIFYLPAKETAGLVVRVAGVVTAVTLTPDVGPEGEDQIEFAIAPANGAEIRFDATAARARVEVFYDPGATSVSDGHLEAGLYTLGGVVLAERIAA